MPGYRPELNPDELLNQNAKTNGLGKSRPTNRIELMGTAHRHAHRHLKQPPAIKNLIQKKHIRYAA
ncbi:MAG: hypothetical protein ACYC9J_14965 [Sulfuricaulis sp.]